MNRLRLTPDIEHRILAHIRSGGFAHVAAEAAGVPRRLFFAWLARGRQEKPRRRYRSFWLNVIQAKAQARLAAELETRKKDVKFWLRYGPGKDALAPPGWGPPGKGKPRKSARSLSAQDVYRLFVQLVQALAPFPEARLAVLPLIEGAGMPPRSDGDLPDRNGA